MVPKMFCVPLRSGKIKNSKITFGISESISEIFRYLSPDRWTPFCDDTHNPLQWDRLACREFGRHFRCVASVIESVGTDVLLFCFLVGLIRRSLVSRVNQITRIYLRIRKLPWPSCSTLWVVTRRITNDERSVRSRVLKRTRTFQNQLKIARYVVSYE